MRLALIVEYDGTEYSGFQYQKNARTVQEEIEKAIESLTGETARIKAAGRTDAGVHAMGQVAAFDTEATYDPGTVMRALNARLPQDIAVRSARRTKPEFDPRRDAVSRLYRYTLLVSGARSPLMRRTAHRLHQQPDLDSMRDAASHMEGAHDFANFGGALEDPGGEHDQASRQGRPAERRPAVADHNRRGGKRVSPPPGTQNGRRARGRRDRQTDGLAT